MQNIQESPKIEKLLSQEEILIGVLIQSWHNRLDREIQILRDKQVDGLKLTGLTDLQGELKYAAIAFQMPMLRVE